jgi:hypothetical protein
MQRASAREPKLTGALKSSPPPELILENDNTAQIVCWLHHPRYPQQ